MQYANLYAGLRWDRGSRRDPHADNEPPHVATPVSAPIQGFLGDTTPGTLSLFAGSWALAYLIATVTLGLGLLIGSLTPVSDSIPIAHKPSLPAESPRQPDAAPVGLITGMVDCQFAEGSRFRVQGSGRRGDGSELPSPAGRGAGGEGVAGSQSPIPHPQSLVHLGDTFALASGLMEITYDTGAKVILQGPVTYEVESKAGGFLSLGKLTRKRWRRRWRRSNPQSLIPNPSSLSTNHYPLFTIKTPTATVTDLGTEFGVEVIKQGLTTSHVFRGSVKVQSLDANARKEGGAIVLHEGESLRTEKSNDGGTHRHAPHDSRSPNLRAAHGTNPKTLDLLDIVAGGYGTTGLRERGIDPTTGMEDPLFVPELRAGDGKYHPVPWRSKMIDGVFIPNGGAGRVVVDSAGHVFGGFPKTDGQSWGSIWARAASVKPNGHEKDPWYWVYAMGPGQQYMPRNLGLLGMSANAGITFNLEAMRTAHPGMRPARFQATAAVADSSPWPKRGEPPLADVWVLVDGQLKMSRTHLRPEDGAIKVDVELGPKDRFLTLVSTDGGNTFNFDWVVFGDPVLEMILAEDPESKAKRKGDAMMKDPKAARPPP